jgi:integrase
LSTKLPYLFETAGRFYFRRKVPDQFRARARCSEWKLALGQQSRDRASVILELRVLTDATTEALAGLKRGADPDPKLLQTAFRSLYPDKPLDQIPTISRASELYRVDRNLERLAKPEQMALNQFIAFAGDVALDEINRKTVRDWISWLAQTRSQSGATLKRRICSISAMCSTAIDHAELEIANPFTRQRLPKHDDGFREPFTAAHLKLIDRWLESSAGSRPSGLIIRLLRGTGARPLEIGGLAAEDILLTGEVAHILIRPNDYRGLKTVGSRRMIPLVGDALVAARLCLATVQAGALFPEPCHHTGSLSARINKAIRSTGVPKSNRLTAYSFRHTLQEAMRVSSVPFDVQQAVMGHAKRSMTERYGAQQVSLERIRSGLMSGLRHLSGE